MKKVLLKFLGVTILMAASSALSACENTAEGFGKDMERAGQNIQNSF